MCDPHIMQSVMAEVVQHQGKTASKPHAKRPFPAGQPEMGSLIIKAERVIDLTHELHEGFPTYIGHRQFSRREQLSFARNGINIDTLTLTEHVGTHIDAPLHFSQDGRSVNEIPLTELIVPLCVIDIRERASTDSDAQMMVSDVRAWIDRYGNIPPYACVAMLSGWGDFVNSKKFRNAAPDGTLHFPGIHPEATEFLLAETTAVGLAVDTLSLDAGVSTDFPTHRTWLSAGAWGAECVANLDQLPATGSTIVVGAPKHRNGTGGPARILALA